MKAVNQSIGNDIIIRMCMEICIGMDHGMDSGLKYLMMLDPIWNVDYNNVHIVHT